MMKLAAFALLAVVVGAAAHSKEKALHGRALLESLKPIGEGAYQSHEAVKERTKDPNTHCEDQKWGPCYRHDYIDKRGSPPTAPPPAKESNAFRGSMALSFIVAIA